MKKIIIIRHSKSSWSEVGLDDFDRPLSERGEYDGYLMSKKLLKKVSKIDLLISSSSRNTFTGHHGFFIPKIFAIFKI